MFTWERKTNQLPQKKYANRKDANCRSVMTIISIALKSYII